MSWLWRRASPAARFCPLCGQTVAPGASTGAPRGSRPAAARGAAEPAGPSAADAGKRKVALAAAAAVVLAALGVFLLWKARSGVLSAQAPATPSAGVISAPPVQTPRAPVLNAPAPQAPSAPVMQAPQTAQNPMPPGVIGYLRWLKQFEAARRGLEYRGMAEMTVFTQKATTGALEGLLNADPTGEPASARPQDNPVVGIGKVIEEWNNAAALFQRKIPPDPCAPLASHYRDALTAGVARMSALQSMLTGALASIQGAGGQATPMSKDTLAELYRQKGTKEGSVDVDTAYRNANAALDQLRAQYTSMPDDVRSFDIKSGAGGLNLPFIGM